MVNSRVHRVVQYRSGIPGVEAMSLYSNHTFPRHSHDQFGIGIVTSGAQRSWSDVGQVESEAGDVIMVNPGEIHDGTPTERSPRAWQIMYLDPAVVARQVAEEPLRRELVLPPVARDPHLAAHVVRLFAQVESRTPDSLAVEESLSCCLMRIAQKHQLGEPARIATSAPVRKAIQHLDAAPEVPTTLAELAALCGVSRFQLLRGFAREVGTTPHAYLVQARVRLARQFLAAGQSPAEAAVLSGFADQSHLTRAFVRHFGITPGRYKDAVRGSRQRAFSPTPLKNV